MDLGKVAGRIHLDMHPREGKDKWFSEDPLIPGINGVELPATTLICKPPEVFLATRGFCTTTRSSRSYMSSVK